MTEPHFIEVTAESKHRFGEKHYMQKLVNPDGGEQEKLTAIWDFRKWERTYKYNDINNLKMVSIFDVSEGLFWLQSETWVVSTQCGEGNVCLENTTSAVTPHYRISSLIILPPLLL